MGGGSNEFLTTSAFRGSSILRHSPWIVLNVNKMKINDDTMLNLLQFSISGVMWTMMADDVQVSSKIPANLFIPVKGNKKIKKAFSTSYSE
jgi:hypothetical protein